MSRRYLLLAATCLVAACPSGPAGPSHPGAVDATEVAVRIRVARAEARRAGGVAELVELAGHGAKRERLLALRGLGRIGGATATGGDARSIAILITSLCGPL